MNNRTKKNSEGASCRGDGDSCKSGCGTGREMRQDDERGSAKARLLCLFSVALCADDEKKAAVI